MHEDLWAGVVLKLEYASYFLEKMSRSLQPSAGAATLEAAGAVAEHPWERSFYPSLDAFLAMTRSIPEIIQCCFGEDRSSAMAKWFNALPAPEKTRRQAFSAEFKSCYDEFREHPLSVARNVSLHRRGYPDVEVSITGRFGVVHIGGAAKRVPGAESRETGETGNDPAAQWAATQPPLPIRPRRSEFTIGSKPLFEECQAYLALAQQLFEQARNISQRVHRTESLSTPC
jgi:hypothetical protein